MTFEFTITNASIDAVHDLHVLVAANPPEHAIGQTVKDWEYEYLVAGQTMPFNFKVRANSPAGSKGALPLSLEITTRFTDIEGRRWERRPDYRLHEVKAPTGG